MKIESLTPEQEASIPAFRQKWLDVGLDTSPIDKVEAEQNIKKLYEVAGLDEPEVLFFDSPRGCLLARKDLRVSNRMSSGDLRVQIGVQLRNQLWVQLRDPLWELLWEQLRNQLRKQLWEHLWYDLKHHSQLLWTIGGLEAYWLAFYDFARQLGVTYSNNEHLDAYINYAKTCGIMLAYEGIAFCSDRPKTIKFDEEKLLHNDSGPAIEFRDGFSVYSRHGVRVTKDSNKPEVTRND